MTVNLTNRTLSAALSALDLLAHAPLSDSQREWYTNAQRELHLAWLAATEAEAS